MLIWLGLSVFLFPVVRSFDNYTRGPLDDVLLQDLAFRSLLQHRPHTGALYNASLPANLSSMEISAVRLRSKTLWSKGTNFSYIHIPIKTLPMPYVRRVFIVYQDFGNWSSYYDQVPGYSLVSSVVGFTAYDASNVSSNSYTMINLHSVGMPVEVRFGNLTFSEDGLRRKKCATFCSNGTVILSDTRAPNVCYSRNQGFYAIVVPLKRMEKARDSCVRGFVFGSVGLALVCSVCLGVLAKLATAKKIHEMEREADEGEGLESIWIGRSKMPSAAGTRTHPVLESASVS